MKESPGPSKYLILLMKEDFLIRKIINAYPKIKWPKILSQIKKLQPCFSRTSKQIRQRWKYHLDPDLKKQPWTQQELEIIFKAHTLNGSKWKQIQKLLPGRSEKSIKNLYYMTLRKSLRRVTKILGAKNSTNQSRQIKAHIITKIIESTNEKPEKRQIIYRLVQLSKIKSGKCKKSLMDNQDIEIYRQLMDQILYFNELYFVDKKHCIEALDLKIENLKTLNLATDKGCQNSITIKASTIPQLQSRDESLLSRCQDDSFFEQSESQQNQVNQQQFQIKSYLAKESQNTLLK